MEEIDYTLLEEENLTEQEERDMGIFYQQKTTYCGKAQCRRCREGVGHGPYWYAYQVVDGRLQRTYIGKHPPLALQETPEGQAARLRVGLLGPVRLERRASAWQPWEHIPESAWTEPAARMLLLYLLSCPDRSASSAEIRAAIFPQATEEEAEAHLERARSLLGQVIAPARKSRAGLPLLHTHERVTLADQSSIWVDADAFRALLVDSHGEGETDPSQNVLREDLLKRARDLYRGDFLQEEREAAWAIAPRLALRRAWVRLLLELADLYMAQEASTSALDVLDRLLSREPANEAATGRLIVVLARLKRRGEALRAYHRLADVLYREYQSVPSAQTRAVYEAVREGRTATGEAITAPEQSAPQAELDSAAVASPMQIGRSHRSRLVGRDSELETLYTLLFDAEQQARKLRAGKIRLSGIQLASTRRPQCALLMGEAGIGKTRLAEELSREALRRGWTVAWSRIYSQEDRIPYRLWTEVLRQAMAQGTWRHESIARRAPMFAPLVSILPELKGLLPAAENTSQLAPEQEQLRLWEAVRDLLSLIIESTPLLITLDDLQWADSSSWQLLAYLARRMPGQPIVIVGSMRLHELPQSHPLSQLITQLERERAVESIPLQPLSDEHITALISHLPEHISRRISERAAGNPFFAEELAKSVEVQITEGDSSTVGLDAALPETITAVLDLCLSRLSRACQHLLAKAAVLGGSFSFQVITEMEANTPGSNEDIALELLEEALTAGVLTEEGTGTRITYQFWHPLLVGHLYERVSAARRMILHRLAADILRRAYQGHEEEHAATITHHLVSGSADDTLIARYAELAGDHAYGLSSYPDAERHYRIALTRLPESAEEQLHRAELLELVGECTRVQGKDEDARHFFERALDNRQGAAHSEQEVQIQALLWCKIGWTWYGAGDTTKARQYYERGAHLLQASGIVAGPVWAAIRLRQSYVFWHEGKYDEARRHALEALELFEETVSQRKQGELTHLTHIRRTLAGDPIDIGHAHRWLGTIEVSSGRYADALVHHQRAQELYDRYNCLRETAIVSCDLGDIYLRRAQYTEAQAALRRSLHLAERVGELPLASVATGNLGVLDLRSGNLALAEAEFRQAIALVERVNGMPFVSFWQACLAAVLQEQGRFREAKVALHHAFRSRHISPYIGFAFLVLGKLRIAEALTTQTSEARPALRLLFRARRALSRAIALSEIEMEWKIESQVALAETAYIVGDLPEAQTLAQLALSEAQRCELTWLVARAEHILGVSLSAQRKPEQAKQYFTQALQICAQHGMRLEYGRTLLHHGQVLLSSTEIPRQEGLSALHEAEHIFRECHAALDEQVAQHAIATATPR